MTEGIFFSLPAWEGFDAQMKFLQSVALKAAVTVNFVVKQKEAVLFASQ